MFREQYQTRVAVVKSELVRYLVCNKGMVSDTDEAADKVERHLQDLFWQLVELRAQPHNMRMCVLAHGSLDLRNIGKPILYFQILPLGGNVSLNISIIQCGLEKSNKNVEDRDGTFAGR